MEVSTEILTNSTIIIPGYFLVMSISSDRKSNDPFLSRPPIVADEHIHSGARTPDNATQQQMYAPQPVSARQENYDLELPPPSYDSTVRNASNYVCHNIILN